MRIATPHHGSPDGLIQRAKDHGISVNEQEGKFSLQSFGIEGTYSVDDTELVATVTKKPWSLPAVAVDMVVRRALSA